MSKDKLVEWVRSQQEHLEDIIVRSAKEYYNLNSAHRTFEFDVKQTSTELWLLGKGKDLCYDRPSIGFIYSLWYHPERVSTYLKYFVDLIYDARAEPSIEIFDLGAGTGAVQWAVGLVVQGLHVLKLTLSENTSG